ncbi:hypothetical protein [Streptomyces naphthomycinicus]|uniref:hypothetical protein n=1 Tax=Streptomyces naphthomycinicus TaxID=2872625 RepID=UPI001CEDFD5B|nr:hypothetical protein [Streptomyces sp. TML10]
MNTTGPGPDHDSHPHLRHLKERMAEHHRRAQAAREESDLEHAVDGAAFDLGTDIARPTAGGAEPGYDVDTDLGIEPR